MCVIKYIFWSSGIVSCHGNLIRTTLNYRRKRTKRRTNFVVKRKSTVPIHEFIPLPLFFFLLRVLQIVDVDYTTTMRISNSSRRVHTSRVHTLQFTLLSRVVQESTTIHWMGWASTTCKTNKIIHCVLIVFRWSKKKSIKVFYSSRSSVFLVSDAAQSHSLKDHISR